VLTVTNGAGTDLDVLHLDSSANLALTNFAGHRFETGRKYQHNFTTPARFEGHMNIGSTCEIGNQTSGNAPWIGQVFYNSNLELPEQGANNQQVEIDERQWRLDHRQHRDEGIQIRSGHQCRPSPSVEIVGASRYQR